MCMAGSRPRTCPYITTRIDASVLSPTPLLHPAPLSTQHIHSPPTCLPPTTYAAPPTPPRVPTSVYPANHAQVTLKPDASHEKLEEAKKQVTDKGGKITHEFSLIKGFTCVPASRQYSYVILTLPAPSCPTTSSPRSRPANTSLSRRTPRSRPSRQRLQEMHNDAMRAYIRDHLAI
jgi:hypothetical protein